MGRVHERRWTGLNIEEHEGAEKDLKTDLELKSILWYRSLVFKINQCFAMEQEEKDYLQSRIDEVTGIFEQLGLGDINKVRNTEVLPWDSNKNKHAIAQNGELAFKYNEQ